MEALKLKEAQSKGQGEDLRKASQGQAESRFEQELAYEKALRRARGDKVHDDVSKLRKVQKTMEMKKKKGQADAKTVIHAQLTGEMEGQDRK